MSSLTTCLKKAGQYIDPADKAAILKSAQALRKSGVSASDAAVQAVQAQIEDVRRLMGDAAPDNAAMFSIADDARAAHGRISRGGVSSPDDLRDMLRVPGYSQWAKSTIMRDVGAAKALRTELEKEYPGFDWKGPKLNDQGVITLYPDWAGASVDSIKRLTAIADRYDVPIAVRGGSTENPKPSLFRVAGFVRYNGLTERNDRLPETIFSLIRPAGGITDTTPLFSTIDGQNQRAGTADYGTATQAQRDAAARFSAAFGGRLAGGPDADLLDAVTPRESTRRGRALASVAAVAERLFNREVVFVKFKGEPKFNGAVSKAAPGFIFINIESQKPIMAVLGHELLHEMAKSQPAMYANLSRRLDDLIKGETTYGLRLAAQYQKQGISTKGLDTREELEADIVGDNFMDAEFWRAMGENQPGLFKRIVNFITQWLDRQAEKLTGYHPFGTDEFLTDIAAARAAVADAMRQFSASEVGAVNDPTNEPDVSLSVAGGNQIDTLAFKRWFGDSKVVDADGKPMVMYHGTNKTEQGEAFSMFDAYASNYGLFGQGAYFTDDASVASEYTSKGKGSSPTVYSAYMSIKNPIDMDADADPQAWADAYPDLDLDAYHEDGTTNESHYRAAEEALRDKGMEKWEGAEAMQDGLRRMGHDGITHIGGGRVKSEGKKHRVFIAFDPEQIKSATGNAGTFDPSNPDIRFARTFDADMFRRMTTPMQRGMEVAAVEKGIAPVLKRWKNGPSVTVVAIPSDLPMVAPFDAHGVYFNGKVYIVAANVRNTAKLMQVLGHEAIAHYGLRESLGATGFRQFTSQVQLALTSGNKPLAAIRAEVRAAYVDENGKFNLSPEQESDEIAAKVVEQAIDADGNFRPGFGFVKAVYAKIVEFLRNLGITVKFTMPELQGMLVNAQRSLEVGKRTAGSRETLAPVFAMTGDQPAANALQALSEMDDLFVLPKSAKTDLQGIADDNYKGIKIRSTSFPGSETMYTMTLPDGSGGRMTVRKSTPRSVYGASDGKDGSYDWIMGRPGENPEDVADNVEDVWIDVSSQKVGEKGAIFYNIAATFAHNTGRIFIGDPAGLSDAALRRRTEQMLSSALKFGTTDHLAPHPRQVEGDAKLKVPGLKWVYGDSVGNIERMIDVSLKSIENVFPDSKLIGYDSASNTFLRTDTGKPIASRRALAELVGRATGDGRGRATTGSGSAQAGWKTVARAALFRHFREAPAVGAVRDGRSLLDRLREDVSRLRRDPATGSAYKADDQILYARSADSLNPPTAGQPDLFTPGFWETPQDTRTDRFIFELQDGRIDLKRVQQAIAKVGGQIREQFDARLAETLYPGRVARRAQQFLEDEAQPLLEVMARNNVPMDELSDYLHARGAEERNAQIAKVNPDLPDGGAGRNSKGLLLTNAAARKYLADVRPARKMVLDALTKRVDAITSGTRKLLVDEGLEKAETIAAWEAAYQNYVPMFRDEAEEGRPHPTGSGMSVRGSASKRATGSTKEVTNILAHVLMQREAAITRAEKNRVAVALYGMALTNPNPDFWTTIRPGMTAEAIGLELQRMGVDPTVAEAGMKGVPTIRTVDPVLNRVVDRPNPIYKSLPGAIVLKVNGDDRVLMLNERDPRGLRMAENLKNLDGLTRLDIAGSVVGKTTRWLASVNTQYNPAFGLVNLTRDTLGGAINLSSTKLRGKTTKVLALTPAAIWGIGRELAGRPSGQWGKLFRQFQADGGQTGYREMFKDANDRTARLQAELKSLEKAGKLTSQKVGGMLLGALDVFNTTLENAVRLAAYKEALQEGMSRAEAARLGRELTVDFNRKGRTGREVSPLYAFFNASVQGSARTLQTLTGPAGAKIIAGGVTLGVMQAMMLLFAGYDDDEIPEFVKSRALVIPLGKNEEGKKEFFTIPYPLGLHVLPNTGRVLTELTLSGGEDVASKGFAAVGAIAGAFNPLGGGNVFTGDGALRTIAPSVIDPIIETLSNKNFSGMPIERESQGENDPRPGFQRAKEATLRTATGQTYTDISRIINTIMGGNEFEKGVASPSPEIVRYWAQVVGGGLLREVEKTVNASVAAAKDEPVKPSGIPVVGRFFGEVDDEQVQRSRYFDNLRQIETIERKIRAAEKANNNEAADRIEAENPLADAGQAKRRAKKEVTDINKEAMETIGDSARLRTLDAERVAEMRELNEEVDAIKLERRGKTPGQRLRESLGVASP